LDEQKHRWNKTHPPDPKYAGKSDLLKLVTEYRAHFNIDLEKIDGAGGWVGTQLLRAQRKHSGQRLQDAN
jgi:hypothetical protein